MVNFYGYECGVLLTKDDQEYKQYSCNNPALPYGFYDEAQGFCSGSGLVDMREKLRKYVETGVDKTYAIISFQGLCDESQMTELLECQDVSAMDYSYFRSPADVVYSVCKIDGEIVEGFLENLITESLDKEAAPVMKMVDAFTESDRSSFYTVSLCPGRFVDVKVCPDSDLIYVMQNADGSTVYGEAGTEQTYPDFQYDESAVIEFVKNNHSLRSFGSADKPSLDCQIQSALSRDNSPAQATKEKLTARDILR